MVYQPIFGSNTHISVESHAFQALANILQEIEVTFIVIMLSSHNIKPQGLCDFGLPVNSPCYKEFIIYWTCIYNADRYLYLYR